MSQELLFLSLLFLLAGLVGNHDVCVDERSNDS